MFSDLCTLFWLSLLLIPASLFALALRGTHGSKAEQVGYRVGKSLLWRMLRGK